MAYLPALVFMVGLALMASAAPWVMIGPPAALAAGLIQALSRRPRRLRAPDFVRLVDSYFRSLARALPLGWLGGFLFGFVILSAADLTERRGMTRWNPGEAAVWASIYGTFVGGVVFPAGHFLLLRRIPASARRTGLVLASAGTVLGGVIGAAFHLLLGIKTGCAGFLAGCLLAWVALRRRREDPL